jgi:hypothetical protein
VFIEKTVPILVDNQYMKKVGNPNLKETILLSSFNAGCFLNSVAQDANSSRN